MVECRAEEAASLWSMSSCKAFSYHAVREATDVFFALTYATSCLFVLVRELMYHLDTHVSRTRWLAIGLGIDNAEFAASIDSLILVYGSSTILLHLPSSMLTTILVVDAFSAQWSTCMPMRDPLISTCASGR